MLKQTVSGPTILAKFSFSRSLRRWRASSRTHSLPHSLPIFIHVFRTSRPVLFAPVAGPGPVKPHLPVAGPVRSLARSLVVGGCVACFAVSSVFRTALLAAAVSLT
ncbi:hypothetical protein BKA80DRAFT_277199 [Phyllosticta citrichinensis]